MHLGLHRQKQRRLNFDEAYNAKFALSMHGGNSGHMLQLPAC